MKKKLTVLLSLVAVALLMVSCTANSPKSVAEKAVKCIIDKDYEGYVDLMYIDKEDASAEEVKQAKEMMVSLLQDKGQKELDKHQGIKSCEAVSEEIAEDGKTARVHMKIAFNDGSEQEEDVKLRKNKDGDWRIDVGK